MKLLVDINVILDVVLERKPWVRDSQAVLNTIAKRQADGYVAGHGLTTIYYLVAAVNGRTAATTAIADLLEMCNAVPLATNDYQRALALGLKDFEDGVTATAAVIIGADYLVTRNEKDFRDVPIAVRSPAGMLSVLRGP